MPDKTKIVFSDGHELKVDEQPSEVLDGLSRRERFPFPRFRKTSDGVDVYVMADQVAYIEQVPEPSDAPQTRVRRRSPLSPGHPRHRIE